MNHAVGGQQLCKRRCEGAAAATKITPGLRSRPFNEWRTNECGGLADLHLFTVLQLGCHGVARGVVLEYSISELLLLPNAV
jgi:hypothetical protein